jgi:hypothetical protein
MRELFDQHMPFAKQPNYGYKFLNCYMLVEKYLPGEKQ